MPVAKKKTTDKKTTTAKKSVKRAPARRAPVREVPVQTPRRRMVGPLSAIASFWRRYFDFVG